MKKNVKNFKNREILLQFLKQQLIFEPEISIILSEKELDEVVKDIENELEPIEYSKEINSDEYVYLIEKYVDKQEKTHLFVQPIELDESFVIKIHIENDVIIVLNNLLEPECFNKIIAKDELLLADYEEEYEDVEECEDAEISNDSEGIPEEVNEFIDQIIKNIKDGECLKCNLLHLYQVGFLDGRNSLALGLSNMLNDLIEEE